MVAICLSVCLFSAQFKKTDAANITKGDIQMFHDESWKPIYFGVRSSNVKVTSYKIHCRRRSIGTFVSAGFF